MFTPHMHKKYGGRDLVDGGIIELETGASPPPWEADPCQDIIYFFAGIKKTSHISTIKNLEVTASNFQFLATK